MNLRMSLPAMILATAALGLFGCSDVGYNPYVQNDGHRPIGKALEAVGPEAANDGLSDLDARLENACD
ncbi:MAG: hypothetical protein ACPMAQ_03005 [Phycisphaerae bacterium]